MTISLSLLTIFGKVARAMAPTDPPNRIGRRQSGVYNFSDIENRADSISLSQRDSFLR